MRFLYSVIYILCIGVIVFLLMLILPIDEVGEPDIERAINQLQELSQKGYIGEVSYEFFESHDDNGNPIWKCNCSVEDEERYSVEMRLCHR